MESEDSIYVLVRGDDTFCVQGFNVFSQNLEDAPTYSLSETKMVILEPGERWEMIIPQDKVVK